MTEEQIHICHLVMQQSRTWEVMIVPDDVLHIMTVLLK